MGVIVDLVWRQGEVGGMGDVSLRTKREDGMFVSSKDDVKGV